MAVKSKLWSWRNRTVVLNICMLKVHLVCLINTQISSFFMINSVCSGYMGVFMSNNHLRTSMSNSVANSYTWLVLVCLGCYTKVHGLGLINNRQHHWEAGSLRPGCSMFRRGPVLGQRLLIASSRGRGGLGISLEPLL